METCNAVQTCASVDESYRVTVQTKSLLQCFRKVRTISFRGDFSSFFFIWPLLGVKGLRTVVHRGIFAKVITKREKQILAS